MHLDNPVRFINSRYLPCRGFRCTLRPRLLFCDASTGLNEEEEQSRTAEEHTAAPELARAIAPVPHSAACVRLSVGRLLALVVLRLHSRRPSADRQQPAGAVVAILPPTSRLAFVESAGTELDGALLSSVVLHLDVARAHRRRPLPLGLASLEYFVACRRHISGVPAVPEADGERHRRRRGGSGLCRTPNSR